MTPEAKAWWSADVVHLLYGVMAAVAAVSYLVASGGHALDLHWQPESAGLKVAADALVCISAGFCAFFLCTIILHRQALPPSLKHPPSSKQGSTAPSDPLGDELLAPASRWTAGGSPMQFMVFSVHHATTLCKRKGQAPQHQESDRGLPPKFLKALSNPGSKASTDPQFNS